MSRYQLAGVACCLPSSCASEVIVGREIKRQTHSYPSTTIGIMEPSSPECTYTSEYAWCVPTFVVILPKITGGISVAGSAYLAKLMISEKKKKPYHRLLLNMSIADILSSTLVHVVGSWMMPQGTSPLSRGNLATCDAQGFIVQIILITIPYLNASLSTY